MRKLFLFNLILVWILIGCGSGEEDLNEVIIYRDRECKTDEDFNNFSISSIQLASEIKLNLIRSQKKYLGEFFEVSGRITEIPGQYLLSVDEEGNVTRPESIRIDTPNGLEWKIINKKYPATDFGKIKIIGNQKVVVDKTNFRSYGDRYNITLAGQEFKVYIGMDEIGEPSFRHGNVEINFIYWRFNKIKDIEIGDLVKITGICYKMINNIPGISYSTSFSNNSVPIKYN